MKKILMIVVLLITVFVVSGCSGTVYNEIYNKSYHVTIDITEFEELVQAVIEKASPAVLGVSNYKRGLLGTYELAAVGSGVVYRTIGILQDNTEIPYEDSFDRDDLRTYLYYMVTNRHVIENYDRVRVYFGEEDMEVPATVVQYDDQVDLAVLVFEAAKFIQPLDFADSDQLKRGSFAVAIGNPSGYEFYGSATFGIVSFPKRYLSDDTTGDGINDWDQEYIQHDVAINPGNSGGPLINMKGEIIGINTMKFVSNDIDNMGFSIPSNLVKELVELLEQGIKPQRAKLGVTIMVIRDLDEATLASIGIPEEITHGLYVTNVSEDGVAFAAGIQVRDIIVAFNGVAIRYSYEMRAELGKMLIGSGDSAIIQVYRDGSYIELEVVF